MMHIDDLDSRLRGAGTLRLLRAWWQWRGGRLLPMKRDMDLNDLRAVLSWVGLLEVVDAETVRLRVAGTGLAEIYGADMTGKNLKDISAPEHWPKRRDRYRALVDRPCGSFHTRTDTLPDGKIVSYETVALPLDVDAAGTRRHVVYCATPLHESFAVERPTGKRALPLAQNFAYVDIGAGAPQPD
jgi:hypothetical protein